MRSSVATGVLTSWAKPRTHVPQHSSGVSQGTGLATIMLDLDMLVQVHFPCTKHSHATYSFSKVEHHLPLSLSKRPNKTIQFHHKTVSRRCHFLSPCPSLVIRGVRVLPVLWEARVAATLGSCHYQGCSWVAIDPVPGRRGLRDVGPRGWMNGNSRSKMKKRSWSVAVNF